MLKDTEKIVLYYLADLYHSNHNLLNKTLFDFYFLSLSFYLLKTPCWSTFIFSVSVFLCPSFSVSLYHQYISLLMFYSVSICFSFLSYLLVSGSIYLSFLDNSSLILKELSHHNPHIRLKSLPLRQTLHTYICMYRRKQKNILRERKIGSIKCKNNKKIK